MSSGQASNMCPTGTHTGESALDWLWVKTEQSGALTTGPSASAYCKTAPPPPPISPSAACCDAVDVLDGQTYRKTSLIGPDGRHVYSPDGSDTASSFLFYRADSDYRGQVADIDTARCPVFLLTGEYDFSCTPEDTLRTAAAVDGANADVMEALGHFPMSENPAQFRRYILPVLERIRGL